MFTAQKKGMRAIAPGFIIYKYKIYGTLPWHAQPYFNKFDIFTVQSFGVLNTLIFMYNAYFIEY